jgi:hypothetical protein
MISGVPLGILAFATEQVPAVPVLHEAVPPVLQLPDTVIPPALPSDALWARMATFAVQVVDWIVRVPSRSPTWSSRGGRTVTVTVAVGLVSEPSEVRYVNVSLPLNPALGVYVTFWSCRRRVAGERHTGRDGVVRSCSAGGVTT